MVRRTYTGIMFPERTMETLKPFRNHVIKLATDCFPFSPEYNELHKLMAAIDDCGTYFTGDPTFFHRKPPVGNGC